MLCMTSVQLYNFRLDKTLLLFKALSTENRYVIPQKGKSIYYYHFKNKLENNREVCGVCLLFSNLDFTALNVRTFCFTKYFL